MTEISKFEIEILALILSIIRQQLVMGNNPTKSQLLQSAFPDFKVLPDLTSHPSNRYQLVFVSRPPDIYTIKESSETPTPINHPNLIRLLETKKVDSLYYSLYEWVPQSLDKYVQGNPHLLNKGLATFLISTCIKVYSYLWKSTDNSCLDILADNIKVITNSSGVCIKVLSPHFTKNSLQTKYCNQISDLGKALKIAFTPALKNLNSSIEQILNKMIASNITNLEQWAQLERKAVQLEEANFNEHRRVIQTNQPHFNHHSPIHSQNKQHSPIPINSSQNKQNYIQNIHVTNPFQLPYHSPKSNTHCRKISNYSQARNIHQIPEPVVMHQNIGVGVYSKKIGQQENHLLYQTQILDAHSNQGYQLRHSRQNSNVERVATAKLEEIGNKNERGRVRSRQKSSSRHIYKNQQPVPVFTAYQKPIQTLPFFEPSLRDEINLKPKIGVPSKEHTVKTFQDKHAVGLVEQVKKSKKKVQSQQDEQSFMEKHLLVKNVNQPELFGSDIPFLSDRSSSFGLTVSEDSEAGVYEGNYEGETHPLHPNVKHGAGKLVFPTGGSYQGYFSWNKMDGWGKLFYPSGRLAYEGYWKSGKFNGFGKLFNENPLHINSYDYNDFNKIQKNNESGFWKVYEGNLCSDLKEGHGVWILQNGEKFEGEFHDDMVHGVGTFCGKKLTVEGRWENNILIEIFKQY